MRTLFKGVRIIDPSSRADQIGDLLLEGDRIAAWEGRSADRVVDGRGLWAVPGLIDMHVHLRDPGQPWKEEMQSGLAAAAAGGYTQIGAMPNTVPVIDSAVGIGYVLERARLVGGVRVRPIGAISKGSRGEELAELGEMKEAGAVAFSDDGRSVMSAELMRLALLYARGLDLPVIVHEEDTHLSIGGAMHRGEVSTRLGLPGIPAAAEEVMVARDLLLNREIGAHLHLAHLSTAGSVAMLQEAKRLGMRVTAEVTPHHLILTDAAVEGFDPNTKMNPPLRPDASREVLIQALGDGTIDIIATDHAPHAWEEKESDYLQAPFGISGLETAVGLLLTQLVAEGRLTPMRLFEAMSTAPARLFGLDGGSLAPGSTADVTLIDPGAVWTVDPGGFRSRGRNTPFADWRLKGRVVGTFVGGKAVFEEGLA